MAGRGESALVAGGAVLEAVAVIAALRGGAPAALAAVAAHLGACCGLSFGLRRRLAPGRAGWSLLLGLTLFLPVLGALGLAATALVRPSPAAPRLPELVRTRIPGLQDTAAAAGLSLEPAASWPRAAQVAAARGRSDPGAIAMLRRAIGDPDEDLRLVAHAVLESKSRAADRRIHQATRALEAAPPASRSALHRRLALEHWELAWLGLAQGECLGRVLEEARRHCRLALEDAGGAGRASLLFLLGRVELRLGDPEGADAALERAEHLGMPRGVVRPYRAEAAFLGRRFDRVREHLAAVPASASPAVERLRRYWS